MTTVAGETVAPQLPDTLRLGPVHLTVGDLDRSIAFYERVLGLRLHRREDGAAAMGAGGEDLVVLVEEPGAAAGGRHAGLYHFALLFPARRDLAHALQRVAAARTRLEVASDHGVSEALYLRDPDSNGIELYADRPRDQWPAPRAEGEAEASPGLVMGHVHLHVGDIDRATAFYCDVLGFEVMASIGSATFVSAGGYHHHLGFNVWLGRNVSPPPPGTAGLREWTIVLESADQVAAVRARVEQAGLTAQERAGGFLTRDPWETAVAFTAG